MSVSTIYHLGTTKKWQNIPEKNDVICMIQEFKRPKNEASYTKIENV